MMAMLQVTDSKTVSGASGAEEEVFCGSDNDWRTFHNVFTLFQNLLHAADGF